MIVCFFCREKGKFLVRSVEVCTIRSQLKEYLLQLCTKLNYCLNMVTLNEQPSINQDIRCLNIDCISCTKLLSSKYYEFLVSVSISVELILNI
jgi:hypothetical protein